MKAAVCNQRHGVHHSGNLENMFLHSMPFPLTMPWR